MCSIDWLRVVVEQAVHQACCKPPTFACSSSVVIKEVCLQKRNLVDTQPHGTKHMHLCVLIVRGGSVHACDAAGNGPGQRGAGEGCVDGHSSRHVSAARPENVSKRCRIWGFVFRRSLQTRCVNIDTTRPSTRRVAKIAGLSYRRTACTFAGTRQRLIVTDSLYTGTLWTRHIVWGAVFAQATCTIGRAELHRVMFQDVSISSQKLADATASAATVTAASRGCGLLRASANMKSMRGQGSALLSRGRKVGGTSFEELWAKARAAAAKAAQYEHPCDRVT